MAADLAESMFAWWNETARSEEGFTAEGFGRFFTGDAALIVNGEERAAGLDALARHFERIRKSSRAVSVRLPLEYGFGDDGHAFVHYRVDALADGGPSSEEAMGYLRLESGRIAVMNVLSRDLP
jgi:hypothetical protein